MLNNDLGIIDTDKEGFLKIYEFIKEGVLVINPKWITRFSKIDEIKFESNDQKDMSFLNLNLVKSKLLKYEESYAWSEDAVGIGVCNKVETDMYNSNNDRIYYSVNFYAGVSILDSNKITRLSFKHNSPNL